MSKLRFGPAPPINLDKFSSISKDPDSIAYREKLRNDFINYYTNEPSKKINERKHIFYSLHFPEALRPESAYEKSAGIDLKSPIDCTIEAGCRAIIDTGISFRTKKPGIYFQLFTRSSYAIKYLIVGGGVIDRDFRGSIRVIIINLDSFPYSIQRGDKIAQAVPLYYCSLPLLEDPIRPQKKISLPPIFEEKRKVSFKERERALKERMCDALTNEKQASGLPPSTTELPRTVKDISDAFFVRYEEKADRRHKTQNERGSKKFGSTGR